MAPGRNGNVFTTTGNKSARYDVTWPTTLCRPRLKYVEFKERTALSRVLDAMLPPLSHRVFVSFSFA